MKAKSARTLLLATTSPLTTTYLNSSLMKTTSVSPIYIIDLEMRNIGSKDSVDPTENIMHLLKDFS